MQINHMDFENQDFADELFRMLEKDYGRSVARVAKFKRISRFNFMISIIFSDFRLMEGEIRVVETFYGNPHIEIHGVYY
jgi:hypothetical protein